MPNPFQLEIQLKQHTPIIHFQHEQAGATLRATEVKPKLDKLIWRILADKCNGDYEKTFAKYALFLTGYSLKKHAQYLNEFLDEKRSAIDYALKIYAPNTQMLLINKDEKIPFYFGNMGKDYNENIKSLHSSIEPIRITFSFKNFFNIEGVTIKSLIEENINLFFLIHNFGTRQSKGYGSFYIQPNTHLYQDPNTIIKSSERMPYSFSINSDKNNPEKFKACLSDLEIVYRAMRSGINSTYSHKGIYLKSWIWSYFNAINNGKFKWEKKTIKEHFLSQQLNQQKNIHKTKPGYNRSPIATDGKELAIKDLFGLASDEAWKAQYNISLEKEIEEVDRFKSPVLFKPIVESNGYRIYFEAARLFPETSIINRSIKFQMAPSEPFSMLIPSEFDFHDFFNYLRNRYSLDKNIVFKIGNQYIEGSEMNFDEMKSFREYKILYNFFKTFRQ